MNHSHSPNSLSRKLKRLFVRNGAYSSTTVAWSDMDEQNKGMARRMFGIREEELPVVLSMDPDHTMFCITADRIVVGTDSYKWTTIEKVEAVGRGELPFSDLTTMCLITRNGERVNMQVERGAVYSGLMTLLIFAVRSE